MATTSTPNADNITNPDNQQKVEHYDKVIKSYRDLMETYQKEIAKMRNERATRDDDRERNETDDPNLVDLNIEIYLQMIERLEQDIVRLREERASYF